MSDREKALETLQTNLDGLVHHIRACRGETVGGSIIGWVENWADSQLQEVLALRTPDGAPDGVEGRERVETVADVVLEIAEHAAMDLSPEYVAECVHRIYRAIALASPPDSEEQRDYGEVLHVTYTCGCQTTSSIYALTRGEEGREPRCATHDQSIHRLARIHTPDSEGRTEDSGWISGWVQGVGWYDDEGGPRLWEVVEGEPPMDSEAFQRVQLYLAPSEDGSEGERDCNCHPSDCTPGPECSPAPPAGERPPGHYVCWCGVVVHGTGVLYETNGDVHECGYRAPTTKEGEDHE